MSDADYSGEVRQSSSAGLWWLWLILLVIFVLGGAFSTAIFIDGGVTIVEAIAGGFAGVVALFLGLLGAVVGIVLGIVGAIVGVVAASGAFAFTAFLVGSPIIAIILLFMLMRSRRASCPDPSVHE